MSKPNIEKEIRRAKELAARFARLTREIASLPAPPELAPVAALDEPARELANTWIDSHPELRAPVRFSPNRHAVRA